MIDRRSLLSTAAAGAALGAVPAEAAKNDRLRRRRIETRQGLRQSYLEIGAGDPIVFLHGNPTSSALWRKIMPYAAPYGRCLAPDLIGMGASDKIPGADEKDYSFASHASFLDAFLEKTNCRSNIVLVVHDWGGPLGFDFARRHPDAIRAIVFMETFVWRYPVDAPKFVLDFFNFYRSPEGARAVLDENQFVEGVLLSQVRDQIDDSEVEAYRRPFARRGADRMPTLAWPRQVPIGDDPPDVARVFDSYLAFMATTEIPKLWINVEPGALIPEPLKSAPRAWKNLAEATVKGTHFAQEQSPHGIGRAIAAFLEKLAQPV